MKSDYSKNLTKIFSEMYESSPFYCSSGHSIRENLAIVYENDAKRHKNSAIKTLAESIVEEDEKEKLVLQCVYKCLNDFAIDSLAQSVVLKTNIPIKFGHVELNGDV